jgi:hypothetical protein
MRPFAPFPGLPNAGVAPPKMQYEIHKDWRSKGQKRQIDECQANIPLAHTHVFRDARAHPIDASFCCISEYIHE